MVNAMGDAGTIAAAAERLRAATDAVTDAVSLGRSASADGWQGEASAAFSSARSDAADTTARLATAYSRAASTLEWYAEHIRSVGADYDRAVAAYDRAADAVRSNPFDLGAYGAAVGARLDAFAALGAHQEAAARAAAELRAAAGQDAEGNAWWDPFGWFTGDESEPDQPVTESITDDDAFDADDVAQGQIGDCFMLSSIVSLLGTDGGDDFIRDNVRWDADREGYWVTLYENGEPKEVFVDNVFGHGARQSDWEWFLFSGDKPSIAALYEAALREEYGYDFLDGGIPADAMEIITGRDVTVTENDSYAGLTAEQLAPLRENLEQGGQVVISSPRSGDHTITVEAPDGSTREVDIVSTHSYAVTRIEEDGSVWMRNPWGPGNSADGGGEFRVSADDVAALFWRATSTNVTAPD
ncbi:C2 family cysteine protease [Microbacterium sp. Clip185]|uniref:C2 family cysteine protease n=1 Tax=Microbacterium sp. Clip185 TaxID=3025663 RepID=UPI002365EC2B|nr:C2 family cysteine protease [Microbacterium sp. Clip185]WDG17910.1 C2 family cysteine protease [Microbacterium sp. Clip185]